jgi:hypothetical protein
LCEINPDEVQQWLLDTCESWHMMNDLRSRIAPRERSLLLASCWRFSHRRLAKSTGLIQKSCRPRSRLRSVVPHELSYALPGVVGG